MHALLAYSNSASPVVEHVPEPEPGPAEVRVEVAAAAVNPVDVAMLSGAVRAAVELPDPVGLGWDVSGVITEVGSAVIGLEPGDRVAGILNVIARKPRIGTHAAETVLPVGAELVTELPQRSFDAVLDAAVLLGSAMSAVRDGGSFVGVAPASPVAAERGIDARTVNVEPRSDAIAEVLELAGAGTLEIRVAGRIPLRQAESAYDKVASGGQRGRWLLIP